jgi:hypothetical protein
MGREMELAPPLFNLLQIVELVCLVNYYPFYLIDSD